MNDAALVEAVEQLRESYSRRQKLASNVLAALKGMSSSLGKAGRLLREYAEGPSALPGRPGPNGTDDATAGRALEVLGDARLRDEAIDPLQPSLRREIKTLTKQAVALRDAASALRGEAVDVVKLGHALSALQAAKIQDQALAALLPQLEHELKQGQQALGHTFGLALRHALAERGIELGGRPPRFEIGPWALDANFVGRSASLSYGKNLIVKRLPLSVEAVLRVYERANKAVAGRDEDGVRWIEQLYSAWETVRRRRDNAEPRANIVECYYELVMLRQSRSFRSEPTKAGFVEYSRAQFAYDFQAFTVRRPVQHAGLHAYGLVATKSQAGNDERSIWIVEGDNPHDGRYIADIKFDRDS